ncbi:hypothetical protein GCM10009771_18650 [Nesterenkonia flava]
MNGSRYNINSTLVERITHTVDASALECRRQGAQAEDAIHQLSQILAEVPDVQGPFSTVWSCRNGPVEAPR